MSGKMSGTTISPPDTSRNWPISEKRHPAPSSKNVGAVEQQRVTVENARKSFPERKRNLPALRIGLVARHRALQDRITGLSAPPREEQGRSLSNEAIPVRDFIERAIRINYSAFHNNRVRIVYDIGHNTEKFRHHVLTYRNVLRTSRTSYMPSRFSEKILKITRSRSSRPQYNPCYWFLLAATRLVLCARRFTSCIRNMSKVSSINQNSQKSSGLNRLTKRNCT